MLLGMVGHMRTRIDDSDTRTSLRTGSASQPPLAPAWCPRMLAGALHGRHHSKRVDAYL